MATAAVTNTFTASSTASSAAVNTNFADLVTFLNGSVVHLDGSKAMAANLDAGSHKIVNVTDPTALQDAATKKYVDDEVGGVITAADITYENLNANGDVGTAATQVAKGNHAHSYYKSGDTIVAAAGSSTVPGVRVGSVQSGIAAGNGYVYVIEGGATVLSSNGSNETYLVGISVGSGSAVYVNGDQLFRSSSSERYKDNIRVVRDELAGLAKQISTIGFTWKPEVSDFGDDFSFHAEQAAAVDPRFATFDDDGVPNDVRDRALLAALYARVEQIAEAVGL